MHAYGEDSCTAAMINNTSLEIVLANGQPASPHKILNRESDAFVGVEFKDAPLGGDEKDGALVLQQLSEANVVSRKTSDGCFEGYERTSTRQARVESVTAELAKTYELKKGMTLNFVCYTSFSAPTGQSCH